MRRSHYAVYYVLYVLYPHSSHAGLSFWQQSKRCHQHDGLSYLLVSQPAAQRGCSVYNNDTLCEQDNQVERERERERFTSQRVREAGWQAGWLRRWWGWWCCAMSKVGVTQHRTVYRIQNSNTPRTSSCQDWENRKQWQSLFTLSFTHCKKNITIYLEGRMWDISHRQP